MSEQIGETLILEFDAVKLDAQVKKIEEAFQIKGGGGGTPKDKMFESIEKKVNLFGRALTKATEQLMNYEFKMGDTTKIRAPNMAGMGQSSRAGDNAQGQYNKMSSDYEKSGMQSQFAPLLESMQEIFSSKGQSGQDSIFMKMDKKMKGMQDSGSGVLKALGASSKLLGVLGIIGIGIGALVATGIQSSSILQASTGIMKMAWDLAWRPLGDAIGYALLPMAMAFLHYAVPFYTHSIGYLMKLAEGRAEIDAKFSEGDYAGGFQAILDQFILLFSGQNKEDRMTGGAMFDNTDEGNSNFIPLITQEDIGAWLQVGYDSIVEAFGGLAQFVYDNVWLPIGNAWNGFTEFVTSTVWQKVSSAWDSFADNVGVIVELLIAPFYNVWDRIQESVYNPISEAFSPIGTWLSDLWEAIKERALGIFDIFGGDDGGSSKDVFGKAGDWMKDILGIEDNVQGLEQSMESVETAGSIALGSADGFADKIGGIAQKGDEALGSASIMGSSMYAIARIFKTVEARARRLLAQARRASARSSRRYATGGIIDEPVAGVGLDSGDDYLFGEAGAERVTPIGQSETSGGGGSKIINISIPITVNGVESGNTEEMIEKMKEGIIDAVKQSLKLDGNEVVLP